MAATTSSDASAVTVSAPPSAEPLPAERKRLLDLFFDAESSMRFALWTMALIALGFTLYLAASLLLPIMVAAMLALLLSPPVSALTRLGLPQALAAGIVVLLVLGALAGITLKIAGPVQDWIETAPQKLRRLEHRIDGLMRPVAAVREASETVSEITGDSEASKPRTVVVDRSGVSSLLDVTVNTLVTVLSTLMLIYFLLACGDGLLRKLVMATPEREDKLRLLEILRTIQREVGRYFATVTLVNMCLGIATGLAMWALGMPTPAVWGVAVALLNFLPYIGALTSVAMLCAVGMLTFDTVGAMLAPAITFMVLNFIEDNLIVPFVLGRSLALNPVVIFTWVLIWAWLWGIGGLLLAVPLLVAVRICAERVPKLKPLAIVLSR
jgi:predicted PurR-regulated permease PerM